MDFLSIACAFVAGSFLGSFINVVVHRLPKMMEEGWNEEASAHLGIDYERPARSYNLFTPRSSCTHCGTAIKCWHNIPLLGYLLLKGKCAHCQEAISTRYPAVELTAGLLSVAGVLVYGLTPLAVCISGALLTLLCLALIDRDTFLLPDAIVYPLLWAGLLVAYSGLGHVSLPDAVLGAVVGYLSLWSVYWVFKIVTGKEGMGYGDFKLLAAIGAWAGPLALINVILFASVSGIAYSIAMKVSGKQLDLDKPVPFGPFLAFGGIVALLF